MAGADGVLNLNYGQLKTAVAGDRLGAVEDTIPQWIADAYVDIWNGPNWTFKRVSGETWYTTDDGTSTGVASASPKMPVAFASVTTLEDDQGCELVELTQSDFEAKYTADLTTGRPCHYMVVNRQIRVWPIPDAAYAFFISYNRRLATRDSSENVQEGWFKVDDDLPLWDDHHGILVIRAKIIGLKSVTDPTYGPLQDEYGRLLEAMVDEYVAALPRGFQAPAWP